MFLVPTYLAASPIHGMGAFTEVALPAFTPIWQFDPRVDWRLTPEEMDALPPGLQALFRVYCYREPDGNYVFCGDNARFMNHSDSPNCDDNGEIIRTYRELAAGEELTCDYRAFDLDAAQGLESYITAAQPLPSPLGEPVST